jgi:hypothetical protein
MLCIDSSNLFSSFYKPLPIFCGSHFLTLLHSKEPCYLVLGGALVVVPTELLETAVGSVFSK